MIPKQYRTCLSCKYYFYSAGMPAFSEYTPACPASICCDYVPFHWSWSGDEDSDIREMLFEAKTCKDYKEV